MQHSWPHPEDLFFATAMFPSPKEDTAAESTSMTSIAGDVPQHAADPRAAGAPVLPAAVAALLQACAAGDTATVQQLLKHPGLPVTARNINGYPALHLAAIAGHAEIAGMLVDAGADVNARDMDAAGTTALLCAALEGHAAVVEMLLAKHADPNAANKEIKTPLHMAALSGNPAMVAALLGAGANVHAADHKQCTPLHYAAQQTDYRKRWGLSRELGAAGVPQASTAAAAAAGKAGTYMQQQLAAQAGPDAVVQVLVAAGADVNAATYTGKRPLHHAAVRGDAATVAVLLGAGAYACAVDNSQYTALHYAASAKREQFQAAAAEGPLNAGQARQQHSSAISASPAAVHGHAEIAALLLAAGASANATAADGDMPLFLAVERQDLGLVRCLLQAGADSNAVLPASLAPQNAEGFSLLAVAAGHKSVGILQALQEAGARSSTVRPIGHDALETALYGLTQGSGSLGMLHAVLADPLFPPSATAAKHAVYNSIGHRLSSVAAHLQLYMFRQCRLEGKVFSDEVATIYRSLQFLDRKLSQQELVVSRPPLGRHNMSMALLHSWQAATEECDAACAELAQQEQDAAAVRVGVQHLVVQHKASHCCIMK